ncbi:hypothetical protein ISN76_07700 [Dyella halodurans]|uniref:Flagellar FliJ protein n=1 Tax=Dyella halodurans TaxID=1920171 RepID=A0ABV9C3Y8_9GAMM|nr:hypothetical protein [Dyella halodurans]
MSKSSVRSYDVLNRIARVKAAQASMALAEASRAEQAASSHVDQASSLCVAASTARERCISSDGSLHLGEYWMLTELHDSLQVRREAAVDVLQEAQAEQSARGLAAGSAQRFADGVEEELTQRRHEVTREIEGRLLADSLELWMQHGEEA